MSAALPILALEPVSHAQSAPPESLERAMRSTLTHIDRVLDRAEAGRFLTPVVREHLHTGGKRVRARLTLSAGLALGAPLATVIPFAAACELLHNATLVHDDLQDGDEVRRGRPTVWVRHGAAQAINAGDLLLMLPTLALDAPVVPAEIRWWQSRALAARAAATAGGQADELELVHTWPPDWDAYLEAATGKTGPFFALPVEGAALAAGVPPRRAAALGDAILVLGALFQLRDDVLDLYGDKGRGIAGNDIREGKISALVVAHLEARPEDQPWLRAILERPRADTTDADVAHVCEAFRRHGTLATVIDRARGLLERLEHAPELAPHPTLRADVLRLGRTLFDPMHALLPQSHPFEDPA